MLTVLLHLAMKSEQTRWFRVWAMMHGLLLIVSVALSIWIMDRNRSFGAEHCIIVSVILYRLLSIMIILLVVRYTLHQPPTPVRTHVMQVRPTGCTCTPMGLGLSVYCPATQTEGIGIRKKENVES